jgi:hypothetical protein
MLVAVENLHQHHIHVLELVEQPPNERPALGGTQATHWSTGLLATAFGMRHELALVAAQGVLSAGSVSDHGLDGGVTYAHLEAGGTILVITEMGRTVLEVLRAVQQLWAIDLGYARQGRPGIERASLRRVVSSREKRTSSSRSRTRAGRGWLAMATAFGDPNVGRWCHTRERPRMERRCYLTTPRT